MRRREIGDKKKKRKWEEQEGWMKGLTAGWRGRLQNNLYTFAGLLPGISEHSFAVYLCDGEGSCV